MQLVPLRFGARTACGFHGEFAVDGRWLRTGDLGVLMKSNTHPAAAPELVITGRLKDVIIVSGGAGQE
jgi:acyl-CoA synthetase (AMP-forming)/AMP-acid ligase II